jgi:hypothetical protein
MGCPAHHPKVTSHYSEGVETEEVEDRSDEKKKGCRAEDIFVSKDLPASPGNNGAYLRGMHAVVTGDGDASAGAAATIQVRFWQVPLLKQPLL